MERNVPCDLFPKKAKFDQRLRDGDKILFSTIYVLAQNKSDCCFASNTYLAKLLSSSISRISHSLSRLRDYGYINYSFDPTKCNSQRRKIYINYDYLCDFDIDDYYEDEDLDKDIDFVL